jgi:hypothetical protein
LWNLGPQILAKELELRPADIFFHFNLFKIVEVLRGLQNGWKIRQAPKQSG